MQEGSPPDPAAESAAPEVTTRRSPRPEEVTEEERTPEQVEAIWKNRVAGKDSAHAAETAELLRDQLELERAAQAQRQRRSSGQRR